MDNDALELLIGRIGKPHGIKGEVTVDVRTDEPELRFRPGAVLLTEPPRGSAFTASTLTVVRTRTHQGVLLATFADFTNRNEAETARGTLLRVRVAPDETPKDPEEFYDHQLIGLSVVNLEGVEIGTLKAVTHGAAQDLLQIRTTDGRDALVPFVAALVPEVDVAAGRLVVADRPGLVAPFPEDDQNEGETEGESTEGTA